MPKHINVDSVQSITISEQKDSGLIYFEEIPKKTIFFGIFLIREKLEAGFNLPHHGEYQRKPIEYYLDKPQYIIECGEDRTVIYVAPTITIYFTNKNYETIYFKTNEQMNSWVTRLQSMAKSNFIKTHE